MTIRILRPLVALTFLTMGLALIPTFLKANSILWMQSSIAFVALWAALGISFAAWQWTFTVALIDLCRPCLSAIRRLVENLWK